MHPQSGELLFSEVMQQGQVVWCTPRAHQDIVRDRRVLRTGANRKKPHTSPKHPCLISEFWLPLNKPPGCGRCTNRGAPRQNRTLAPAELELPIRLCTAGVTIGQLHPHQRGPDFRHDTKRKDLGFAVNARPDTHPNVREPLPLAMGNQ